LAWLCPRFRVRAQAPLAPAPRPFKEAVGTLRFGSRELERAFAERYDIIEQTPDVMD
jgi:hypothetical protein